MNSPYEKELITMAENFCSFLQKQYIKAQILKNSLREYQIKVELIKENMFVGKGVIYYSPNKKIFRLVPENIKDKAFESAIRDYWYAMINADAPQAEEIMNNNNSEEKFGIEIYVDGCYKNNKTGYGAVILKNGELIKEFSDLVPENEVMGTHQIAGELESVIIALKWCMKNNIKSVKIYHDLENTQKWATGTYQARSPVSQRFVAFLHQCNVEITWQKVRAHSADRWNEYVDKLAKKATEVGKTKTITQQTNTEVLDKIITEFLSFMKGNDIDISLEKEIPANNYARFKIKNFEGGNFLIELYHTEKKPLNFQVRSASLQDCKPLRLLCDRFKIYILAQSKEKVDPFNKIKYYHFVLEPYQKYNFDFIDFAKALMELVGDSQDVEQYRYDFKRLDSIYQNIISK